jgi:hypothetical protein
MKNPSDVADVEQGNAAALNAGTEDVLKHLQLRLPSVCTDAKTKLLLGDPVVDQLGQSIEKEDAQLLGDMALFYPNRALKSLIAAEVEFVLNHHPEHAKLRQDGGWSWHTGVSQQPHQQRGPPDQFYCPITRDLMIEPVISPDGYTFEKEAIERWLLQENGTCPVSRQPLKGTQLRKNLAIQECIQAEIVKPHLESHSDVRRWRDAKAAAQLTDDCIIHKQLPSSPASSSPSLEHDPRHHRNEVLPQQRVPATGSAVGRFSVAATTEAQRQAAHATQARIAAARKERLCMSGILLLGFISFALLNGLQ